MRRFARVLVAALVLLLLAQALAYPTGYRPPARQGGGGVRRSPPAQQFPESPATPRPSASPKAKPKYPVRTLLSNGSPERKLDLVFVGDGYSDREKAKFDARVQGCLALLWTLSPFRELKGKFNVHVVYIPSPKGSGWDDQGQRNPTESAFGLKDSPDRNVKIDANPEQMRRIMEASKCAPGADAVVLLTTREGRSCAHLGNAVILAERQIDAVGHELGHLIANLGDEYVEEGQTAGYGHSTANGDLPYANLQRRALLNRSSRQSLKVTAKWGHLMALPGSDPLIGAFEGGHYAAFGVFRPSQDCHMRDHRSGDPFCPVCHEELYKAILARTDEAFQDSSYHANFPLSDWR